jgi:hypothetical protein
MRSWRCNGRASHEQVPASAEAEAMAADGNGERWIWDSVFSLLFAVVSKMGRYVGPTGMLDKTEKTSDQEPGPRDARIGGRPLGPLVGILEPSW